MSLPNYDYLIKVVVVGQSYVGKTSLISRYVNDRRDRYADQTRYYPTERVEYYCKIIRKHPESVKFMIWDTSGADMWQSYAQSYYHGGVIMIVYDVSDVSSFARVDEFLNQRQNLGHILIGNKADAVKERQITYQQGADKAKVCGIPFFECSAYDYDLNLDLAFEAIADLYLTQVASVRKQVDASDPDHSHGS